MKKDSILQLMLRLYNIKMVLVLFNFHQSVDFPNSIKDLNIPDLFLL